MKWNLLGCSILAIALAAISSTGTAYEFSPSPWAGCWHKPAPISIQAAIVRAENSHGYSTREQKVRANLEPAVLALSGEGFRTPYGAGLLVGWGETGRRPNFYVVTGVGLSAVIAPFAFLGDEGDQKLADVFNCNASSWKEIAEHAAGLIDAPTVEKIARKYATGARLLVALPGSPARPETVWDLGMIAASRRSDAGKLIGDILVASVSLESMMDPKTFPVPAGFIAQRNFTFRDDGAGEPFLSPGAANRNPSSYFLIHSAVLVPHESSAYIAGRLRSDETGATSTPLVAAYDLQREALARRAHFRFAGAPYEPSYEDVPEKLFDMDFTRRLFLKTYWEGVLGGEWQSVVPGAPN